MKDSDVTQKQAVQENVLNVPGSSSASQHEGTSSVASTLDADKRIVDPTQLTKN